MTVRRIAGVMVVACIAAQSADLGACGDKFLVASRGTRFQKAGFVRRPARVLVYAAPASRLAAAITTLGVPDALMKVGYSATIVGDPSELARALRDGRWDLVLTDLADAASVPRGGAAPALVTVAYDASSADLKQARRSFDGVVKAPGRARAVVDVVDDVLFARALRGTAPAKASN